MPLTRHEYDVLWVTISWLAGFAPLFAHAFLSWRGHRVRWQAPTWLQSVGLALVVAPFARMAVSFYLTMESGALFTYTVLQPASQAAIWRAVRNDAVYDLAMPAIGLLLLFNAMPWLASKRAPRSELRTVLKRANVAPRETFAKDALHGLTLFAFIAAAYAAAWILSKTLLADLSANGDESRYWINITVLLIVLRSGMAGLTEELLFRGILLGALARKLPFAAAAVVQAVLFGLVHAGYGTWSHVLGPLAFGLGMAWVARVLSVPVAMLLHAQINVVFFAFEVSGYVPGAWWLIAALAALNVVAAALTRFAAVRILWRSLLRPFRRGAPAETDEPRVG